jgi:hypothetical protein
MKLARLGSDSGSDSGFDSCSDTDSGSESGSYPDCGSNLDSGSDSGFRYFGGVHRGLGHVQPRLSLPLHLQVTAYGPGLPDFS